MTKSPQARATRLSLLRRIRLVCFDFDGVFTDNRVLVSEDDRESVWCCRSDGIGLARLKSIGVDCVVVSSEKNPVVGVRMKKLGIECHSGAECKQDVVKRLLKERRLTPADAAFVGNDLPDIICMRFLGVGIAVCDAYPEVRAVARLVTSCRGGYGAVREICDWIIEAHQASGARPEVRDEQPGYFLKTP